MEGKAVENRPGELLRLPFQLGLGLGLELELELGLEIGLELGLGLGILRRADSSRRRRHSDRL